MNPFEIFGGMGQPSQYLDKAGQYFKPYYAAGTAELPGYMHTLNQLTRHPTGFEDQVMGQYQMSPHAQYQTQLLNQTMANQAAAGGQVGTPNEQIALANQTQGIVSKDQQQYYNNALAPFQMGLSGEQYLTGMGMKAGAGMAGQKDLAATLSAKEREAEMGMFGSIAGAGANLASLAFL